MNLTTKSFVDGLCNNITSDKANLAKQRFNSDLNHYSNEVDMKLKAWRENLIDIFAKSISDDLEQTYAHLTSWGNDGVNLLV